MIKRSSSNMKLAWICYVRHYDDENERFEKPVLEFKEPESYRYHTVIPIVYTEIEENEDN